jgi:hypothetical protein
MEVDLVGRESALQKSLMVLLGALELREDASAKLGCVGTVDPTGREFLPDTWIRRRVRQARRGHRHLSKRKVSLRCVDFDLRREFEIRILAAKIGSNQCNGEIFGAKAQNFSLDFLCAFLKGA